ncbi:OmpL47-type beta-barrel domain-containing protein [Nanoarchaeota archaeon]
MNNTGFGYNGSVNNGSSTGIQANATIEDGSYNWTVNCTDLSTKVGSGGLRVINVDTGAPSVSVLSPVNDSDTSDTSPIVTFNFTDALSSSGDCVLFVDGVANESNSSTVNNTNTELIPILSEGDHSYFVNCTDLTSISGVSGVYDITVDVTAPVVSLNAPVSDYNSSSTSVTFNFSVVDVLSEELNCSLSIDGAVNVTNSSLGNDTDFVTTVVNISDGGHDWNVTCLDLAGNSNFSVTRGFSVDTTPVTVNLDTPIDDANVSVSQPTFAFNFTNGLSATAACELFVGGVGFGFNGSVNNGSSTGIQANASIDDGSYNWTVNCTDLSAKVGSGGLRVVNVDTTAPVVYLEDPEEDDHLGVSQPVFSFNFTDAYWSVAQCELFVDGVGYGYNGSVVVDTSNAIQANVSLVNGSYSWNVNCTDGNGNSNISVASRNLTIDSVAPVIVLESPIDTANVSFSQPNFTFNFIDVYSDEAYCELFVDGVGYGVNDSVVNDTSTVIQANDTIPDGGVSWTVNCTDYANNEGVVAARTLTVDIVAPSVSVSSPVDDSYTPVTSPDITFSFVDVTASVASCELFVDGVADVSNSSVVDSAVTVLTPTLAEGNHSYVVNCTDPSGNSDVSVSRTITVDNSNPIVSLSLPVVDYNSSSSSVLFNFSVADAWSDEFNCSLFIDGVVNVTNTALANNTPFVTTVDNINDGGHDWNVSCIDLGNNSDDTVTRVFSVDTIPVTVNLETPIDDANVSDNQPTFVFNFTNGASTSAACELFVGSVGFGFNGSVNNGSSTNISANASISDGSYDWTVNCTDLSSKVGSGGLRVINIDTTGPVVYLEDPEDDADLGVSQPVFSFNFTDAYWSVAQCELFVDGVGYGYNGSVAVDTSNAIQANVSLANGSYTWNVNCTDMTGNENSSDISRNLIIDSVAPAVTLETPIDNANVSASPSFSFNYTDQFSEEAYCELFIDGVGYGVNDTTLNATTTTIPPNTSLSDGSYSWTVNCTDYADNLGTAAQRTINVDSAAPEVSLITPIEGANTIGTPDFTFNFTDASNTASCELFIDNIGYGVNASSLNGSDTFISPNGSLSIASHTWAVNCTDQLGNVGNSSTRTVDVGPQCGDIITSSYTMVQSLTNCAGNGIYINASNIVFDCNGYTISGDNSGADYGIYIDNGLSNVTVRNCTIYDFSGASGGGIYSYSTNELLESNTINNSYYGIFLNNPSSGLIQNNVITNSVLDGIYYGSGGVTNITENTLTDSGRYGLNLGTVNVRVWHNNVYNSATYNVYSGTWPFEISFNGEGNYWGRSSCPTFIGGTDSNDATILDKYAYNASDGWDTFASPPDCHYLDILYFEDIDLNDFINLGIGNSMLEPENITLFLGVNYSGFSSTPVANLTHNGYCLGAPNPYPMTFDGVDEFNVSCSVNKSMLTEGIENIVTVDAYLTVESKQDDENFTIYADFTRPNVNFNWRNTTEFGTGNPIKFPEPHNLLDTAQNPDFFYSPADNTIYLAVNATDDDNISMVSVTFMNVSNFPNCDKSMNLSFNAGSGLWEGNCTLGSFNSGDLIEDQPGSAVQSATIEIYAYDEFNNVNNIYNNSYDKSCSDSVACVCNYDGMIPPPDCYPAFTPVLIHDLGPLESDDPCMQFGPSTTNFSDEYNFGNLNLLIDVQFNLSCMEADPFLPSDFISFLSFNFSSLNFEEENVALKLEALPNAIEVNITGPNEFGNARIYLNSTYFAELNTTSTINFLHLPFTSQPNIVADFNAAGVSAVQSWVSGFDALLGTYTGNLTFVVNGFSGYNITDNQVPTVVINSPADSQLYNQNITNINFTVNGTGTEPSYIELQVNSVTAGIFNNSFVVINTTYCSALDAARELWNCNTPVNLADGQYNISVDAYDFGGDSPGYYANASISITVDSIAPSTSDDNLIGWQTSLFNVTLTPSDINGSGVNYTSYQLDGGGWINGTLIPILSDANHTLNYYSVDTAGNVEATNTVYASLDTADPSTSDNAPVGWQTSSFTINFSAIDATSGVNVTRYQIDGSGWSDGDFVVIGSDGNHSVEYYSVDTAGNVETTNTVYAALDANAPSSSDDAPSGWQTSAFNVTLNASDTVSGVDYTSYRVDGGSWVNGTQIQITLDGNYSIDYYSVDVAGGVESTNTINVLLDTTDPSTSDDAPVGWQTSSFDVTLTPGDVNGSGVAYTSFKLDGGSWVNGSAIVIDSDGNHSIDYYSVDNVGNVEATNTVYAGLDTADPSSSDDAPSGWQTNNVVFNISASDAGSSIAFVNYSIDGVWATGQNVTVNTDANHTIQYYAVDKSGRQEGMHTIYVAVDKIAPVTSDDAPVGWQNTAFTITLTTTEVTSNVSQTRYQVDGGGWNTGTSISINTDGNHSVEYYSTDNAGNTEAVNNISAALDTTLPIISSVSAYNVTNVSAEINATSDESSTCFVDYGTTSAYSDGPSGNSVGTSHAWTLSSLSIATTYYYRINCTDVAGNSDLSSEYSFTTTASVTTTFNSSTAVTLSFNSTTNGTSGQFLGVEIDPAVNFTGTIDAQLSSSNPESVALTDEIGVYVTIESDEINTSSLDSMIIYVYYDENDLGGADETDLVLYLYEAATSTWVIADPQGLNTTGDYLWADVSGLSSNYSLTGPSPQLSLLAGIRVVTTSPPSPPGGGGGGSLQVAESCSDGIKNQGEDGIDCGGPCSGCASCSDEVRNCHDGACEKGIDCEGPCAANCAAPPGCDDGIKNGYEKGVDCGGYCISCEEKEAEEAEKAKEALPEGVLEQPGVPEVIVGGRGDLVGKPTGYLEEGDVEEKKLGIRKDVIGIAMIVITGVIMLVLIFWPRKKPKLPHIHDHTVGSFRSNMNLKPAIKK